MPKKFVALMSALVLLAALPGCGGDDKPVSGQLWLVGSWPPGGLSGRVADLFQQEHPGITVSSDVPSIPSWDIFCDRRFNAGFLTVDRRVSEGDAGYCAAIGMELVELPVAVEAIAVITGEGNPLDCVGFADLYALVGPESSGFGAWAQAEALASELGSASVFPDVPLSVYGPGLDLVARHSFGDFFLAEFAVGRAVTPEFYETSGVSIRKDYRAEADYAAIVDGVRATDFSFGWVDYATAASAEGIKVLEVDGGNGCMAATPETIASGDYPLSRPIYLYVDKATAAAQPHVSAFVDFYLTDRGLETAVDDMRHELGYLSLTEEAKAATRAAWANR